MSSFDWASRWRAQLQLTVKMEDIMGTLIHAMVDQFCVAFDEAICSLNRRFADIAPTTRLL
jgi:hypothetical protein